MTTITDRAAFFADAKLGKTVFVVLHKDARELESMCEELAAELEEIVDWMKVERAPLRPQEISSIQLKLARYQQLKEKAK